MASNGPQPIRWIEQAEDPELEEQLVRELEARRRGREAERRRKRADRRSRRLFLLFVVVMLALVATLAYGVVAITRTIFG